MNDISFFISKRRQGQNSMRVLADLFHSYIPEIKVVELPYESTSIYGIIKNILFAIKKQGKINHIFQPSENYLLPFLKGNKISTIHDIYAFRYNQKYFSMKHRIIELFDRIRSIFPTIFFSNQLHVVSEFTKSEYINIIKPFHKDIEVIYQPFHSIPYVKKQFNANRPLILQIGLAYRKNILNTIKALKDINCSLYMIGKLDIDQKELLNLYKIDYYNECDIDSKRLEEFYAMCDIVSFPTSYEGFGLVILEANSAGRCVVSSDIPVIHEVGGDSVCYVNPFSAKSIHAGFLRILSDDNYRNSLVERGFKNVLRFNNECQVKQFKEKLYS
jgi:glycosyltransferase involved in cell wall biosynthesis